MWITNSYVRSKTSLHIQYIIIAKECQPSHLFPPEEFNNSSLKMIQQLPKNLIQLDGRTTEFIGHEWNDQAEVGYDLSIVFDRNLKVYLPKCNNRQVTVLFIDDAVNVEMVLELFAQFSFMFYYYYPNKRKETNYFFSPFELISLLKRDKDILSSRFQGLGIPVNFKFTDEIPDQLRQLNKLTYFTPSLGNTLMLNQYIGNFWHDLEYIDELRNITDENVKELAVKSSSRNDRMNILIKQIEEIDSFRSFLITKSGFKNSLGNAIPYYTPLIIISPFQYPKPEEIYPAILEHEKSYLIKEVFKTEQDLNYKNVLETGGLPPEKVMEKMQFTGTLIQQKLQYLDSVAYLHASFSNSPILRLPLKGRSLNLHLSIFDPSRTLPARQKFFKAIKKFGESYVSSTMNKDVQECIMLRNRQLVFISDLPVEWFNIQGVPISITHDTTRLPENPYGGLMGFYVKNTLIKYNVPQNIVSKTLVIFGAPTSAGQNPDFEFGYRVIEKFSKEIGFHTARCNNISELKSAIEKHKPELLILDTHGATDKKNKTSQLQIGTDWLTGDDIIKNNISAPLVILSACNTVPNWGYLNPITNAFFEAGCISVTGTFLPIGIISGTTFYHRILRNLNYAAKDGLHNNWLNFLGHNIRSHYLMEVMNLVNSKLNDLPLDEKEKHRVKERVNKMATYLLTASTSFTKRRKVFMDFASQYGNLHPKLKIDLLTLPFEQLIYTNMGRGDLVFFDSWIDRMKKENSDQE